MEAYRFLGSPEGELALAQAVVYVATAPKSNALYLAWGKVSREVASSLSRPVPVHLRNAPTKLMKQLGYGREYLYPHDFPEAVVEQDYFPEGVRERRYYRPTERGYEKRIKERLEYWRAVLGERKKGG
jgi:putative ATPase